MMLTNISIFLLLTAVFQLLPVMETTAKAPTARQVIAEIQKNLTCQWSKETVDTFKSGNPDDVVTGVATSMFANMETLKKAVANKCNLIIAHEPTFYNHLDKTDALENDPVYQKKK